MNKVLFITYLEDFREDAGDKIYSINIIRELEKIFNVHVICFARNDKKNILHTSSKGSAFSSLFSIYPFGISAHRNSQLKKAVINACLENDYKHIFLDHFRLLWLIKSIQGNAASRTVYISHNIEHLSRANGHKLEKNKLKKIALYADYLKTLFWEKRLIQHTKSCSAISETDAELLSKLSKKVSLLKPGYSGPSLQNKEFDSLENTVIWVGSFKFFAKRLNLLEFCDAIQSTTKKVNFKLLIVGLMDDDFFNTLKNRYEFCQVHPNVDSVFPYLKEAKCGIIFEPVGGGFKLKSLDYIFTRTPIFALRGSCEGVGLEKGISFIENDSAEELISSLNEYIDSPNQLRQISDSAYTASSEIFSWSKLVGNFLNEQK
ncbi:hypothetical protein [Pseudomonas sp. DSV-1]|uniref:hypothetical protein n=1 Tax=Pseudomonas sp. DSV-1 TaxID=3112250 RepID=UPI002DB5DE60|nr:hypothetical protein [Pseudomonas sp. DSV-1]MEC4239199.1 hypothetical protein [Pseudomonas sp. DSV-1]